MQKHIRHAQREVVEGGMDLSNFGTQDGWECSEAAELRILDGLQGSLEGSGVEGQGCSADAFFEDSEGQLESCLCSEAARLQASCFSSCKTARYSARGSGSDCSRSILQCAMLD